MSEILRQNCWLSTTNFTSMCIGFSWGSTFVFSLSKIKVKAASCLNSCHSFLIELAISCFRLLFLILSRFSLILILHQWILLWNNLRWWRIPHFKWHWLSHLYFSYFNYVLLWANKGIPKVVWKTWGYIRCSLKDWMIEVDRVRNKIVASKGQGSTIWVSELPIFYCLARTLTRIQLSLIFRWSYVWSLSKVLLSVFRL